MTNLDNSDEVLKIYLSRIGIKAMFKDYKTGGYNLEVSQTNTQGLTNLILLIAIAYTASYYRGKLIKKSGHQNLICLLTEVCKKDKRHSNFGVVCNCKLWVIAREYLDDIIQKMMNLNPEKSLIIKRD